MCELPKTLSYFFKTFPPKFDLNSLLEDFYRRLLFTADVWSLNFVRLKRHVQRRIGHVRPRYRKCNYRVRIRKNRIFFRTYGNWTNKDPNSERNRVSNERGTVFGRSIYAVTLKSKQRK